jgi:two-component system, OmpR family, phosphate regulon sensor histidine kinase PhoR
MLGLRGRMAATAAAATAGALLVVLLLAGPRLHARAMEHTERGLVSEARLMARVAEAPLARGEDTDTLDPVVDEIGRSLRARVTLIAPDGRVLADSAVSGAELRDLENHRTRPEVREAFANGVGVSSRRSATLHENLLYAAALVGPREHPLGIARLALTLDDVEAQASEFQQAVVFALLLAFLITAGVSAALSSPLLGPLAQIMETARQFAAGNLGARIAVTRRDELGELARILNQSANQLQERLAENARERARSEAILSAMEDGVLAVDHRGVVLLANDALSRSFDLEHAVGRHYLEVVRQREVGEVLDGVLRTGERRAVEVELRHLGRTYALSGVSFPGPAGSPHGAVLTFHDITERRKLERIRRDFVANASHELRTPLTSIRGFVEALEDGGLEDPGTASRFLAKIRTHADRMTLLVQDLLELSRLESGQQPPRLGRVAPFRLALETVESFSNEAARKQIALRAEDAGAPEVVSDPDRILRVLEALVDNALKYTPAGGHVTVRAAGAAAGGAFVEVEDDGPGIPPEHQPRIFERFYRVDKARSRELGGTGLGLSIARHLAEGMGATLAVTSAVGRGTRFTVTVPARPSS